MSHTIAIRLPKTLFKNVQQSAKLKKKTRSQIIREALENYFERGGLFLEKDPYQALLALMPLEGSGQGDLASRSKFYLRQKFHERSRSH